MITSKTLRKTLFYFTHVEQIRDFESVEICPLHGGRPIPDCEAAQADSWCVIGIFNQEQAKAHRAVSFPIADLPTELYADLFAQLCRQLIANKPGSDDLSTLEALQSQALMA